MWYFKVKSTEDVYIRPTETQARVGAAEMRARIELAMKKGARERVVIELGELVPRALLEAATESPVEPLPSMADAVAAANRAEAVAAEMLSELRAWRAEAAAAKPTELHPLLSGDDFEGEFTAAELRSLVGAES